MEQNDRVYYVANVVLLVDEVSQVHSRVPIDLLALAVMDYVLSNVDHAYVLEQDVY